MPNDLIVNVSQEILFSELTSDEKIVIIRERFRTSSEIYYDEDKKKYFERDLGGFITPETREKYLIDTQGLAVNMEGRSGWRLLMSAVQAGDIKVMKWLIDQGANINLGNHFGISPLHIAILYGQVNACKFLLEYGATLNANNHKMTPLDMVTEYIDIRSLKRGTFFEKVIRKNERIDYIIRSFENNESSIPSLGQLKSIKTLIEHKKYSYNFYIISIEKKGKLTSQETLGTKSFISRLQSHHTIFKKMDKKKYPNLPPLVEMNILEFINGNLSEKKAVFKSTKELLFKPKRSVCEKRSLNSNCIIF